MNKLEKFDNLIEKLTSCVDFYNHSNMFNNKVSMYLANGELINVRFPKGGLAHLLGINIDYLRFTNKFRGDMNSYECLLYFLDESYTFRKLLQEGMISLDELFSKNVDEKIEAFKENVRIKVDDMLTIVKYDSERTYKIEEVADISNYYIIRQKNGSYYVLGLVRDEQKNIFCCLLLQESMIIIVILINLWQELFVSKN